MVLGLEAREAREARRESIVSFSKPRKHRLPGYERDLFRSASIPNPRARRPPPPGTTPAYDFVRA